jgi:hypothetical protein
MEKRVSCSKKGPPEEVRVSEAVHFNLEFFGGSRKMGREKKGDERD